MAQIDKVLGRATAPSQIVNALRAAHGGPAPTPPTPKIKTWQERANEALGDHWRGYKPDSYMEAEIADLRAALARAPLPDNQEAVLKFAIKVEKALCAALGREWSASGISIESLIKELADRAPLPAKDEVRASGDLRKKVVPRNLSYSLDDYWQAPSGIGPLSAAYKNKPHQLLYDLIAALLAAPAQAGDTRDEFGYLRIADEGRTITVVSDERFWSGDSRVPDGMYRIVADRAAMSASQDQREAK